MGFAILHYFCRRFINTKEMMYNFSYFKCRLERCELGIGGTPSLQGKGALKDKVSESRFNDYTNPDKKDHFIDDKLYDKYHETISTILKDITE